MAPWPGPYQLFQSHSFWSSPLLKASFVCWTTLFILYHNIWRLRHSKGCAFYLAHCQKFDSLPDIFKNTTPTAVRPCSITGLMFFHLFPHAFTVCVRQIARWSFSCNSWNTSHPYKLYDTSLIHIIQYVYWAPTISQVQFQALRYISEQNRQKSCI